MPPCSFASRILCLASIATLGVFCNGCELFDSLFDESVSLADFNPGHATVSVEFAEFSRAQIVLEAKDGSCPTIREDIEARVDDQVMDLFMRGGQKPTSTKEWVCGSPTFRRSIAESDLGGETARFAVEDDTAKVAVEATALLQARSLTAAIVDAPMVPGVESAFEWSVATDEVDPDLLKVDFVYDDTAQVLSSTPWTRVEGSLVFIRLPIDSPAGAGKLQVDVTAAVPIVACSGVTSCEGTVHAVVEIPIDVMAP